MPDSKSIPNSLKEVAANEHQARLESTETKINRILECPPELGAQARLEWNRITPGLTILGILSSFDLGPLAAYCTAYGLWIEAIEMVQKHGAMIKSPNGYPMQSPYLSHANKQFEIMMKIATEFGFTPASRARIFTYSQKNSMLLEAIDEIDDRDIR